MPAVWVRPKQQPNPNAIPFAAGDHAGNDDTGMVLGGRYELLEILANGGTSIVYAGRCRHTGGAVAVKVLYQTAKEAIEGFFQQEGRLAARIQNPHLVHARDFGECDGRLYIVFELVPGEALPELYFQELMPWTKLLQVVLQVLDGLAALHAEGVVHRDVKPDNIIVAPTVGGGMHVTLLDLGFCAVPPARRLTGAPEPTPMVYGTHGFIAPELLGGALPDPRNDLYSVGAMMYLMLTAQQVPDIGAAPGEMMIPSPRAFVPALPQAVDDIVMRALSDVSARYQSADEMATEIRAALAVGEAKRDELTITTIADEYPGLVAASATSTGQRNSRPRGTLAAAVLLGALVGGTAVWMAGPSGASGLPDAASSRVVAEAAPESPASAGQVRLSEQPVPPVIPLTEPLVASLRHTPDNDAVLADIKLASPAPPPVRPDRESTSKLLVSSVGPRKTREALDVRTQGATFEQVMAKLANQVQACAGARADGGGPDHIDVRVRFDPEKRSIDQVRILKLGASDPLADCVERVIRAASPPASDNPNETFTYMLKR